MLCEVEERSEGEAHFSMEFEPLVFEQSVISSWRELHADEVDKPELTMLSTSALLAQTSDALDVVRAAVQNLLNDNVDDALSRLNLVPTSEVKVQPIQDGVKDTFAEPFVVKAVVSVAPDLDSLTYEGLHVVYDEVVLDGTEVDLRLENARERYGVSSDEELLDKMPTYDSVEAMREGLAKSCSLVAEELNATAKREATGKALVEANPIEVSAEEIDRYVDGELEKLKGQMGEQTYAAQDYDEDTVRAVIRRDVGHVPRLNKILEVIAADQGYQVTDEERRQEIERARAQSVNPSSLESTDETLEALQSNSAMMHSLDKKISLDKALDLVMSTAVFEPHLYLTLREAAPHYVNQL